VYLLLVDELDSVLHGTQESVSTREGSCVIGIDVARHGHLVQRRQRVGRAQPRVGLPVHELEDLGRELDVADAAGSPLEVAIGQAAPAHLGFGPPLHLADRSQVVGGERVVPQPALRSVEEAFT